MNVLRPGSIGPEVARWQNFLIGQGFYRGVVDASFNSVTEQATMAFQRRHGLKQDSVVARMTLAKAIELGFGDIHDDRDEGSKWPPRPELLTPNQASREVLLGRFRFTHTPREGNPEKIAILDGWDTANLELFEIPQLKNVKGAPDNCKVLFHKKVGAKVQHLFRAWDASGLTPLVLTWGGSFASRFIRGSTSQLSAHAHGSAFDINMVWNSLGAEPALVGKEGSVRKLVPIANQLGFYWGGHFRARPDGMHFELVKIV